MKPPKNIFDYAQCIKRQRNDIWLVFCVECNAWYQIAIHSRSNVIIRQSGARSIRDYDQTFCCCSNCLADVEYLLTPDDKNLIEEKCGIK
jgi:hypothetical protein